MRGGFTAIDAESFGLTAATKEEAQSAQAMGLEEQRRLAVSLDDFDQQASSRLSSGVQLWDHLARTGDLPTAAREPERGQANVIDVAVLVTAFNAFSAVMPFISELRRLGVASAMLEDNRDSSPDPRLATSSLAHVNAAIEDRLGRVHGTLKDVRWPPSLDVAPMTQEASGVTTAPLRQRSAETVNHASAMYFEILARLSAMAVTAETHVPLGGP